MLEFKVQYNKHFSKLIEKFIELYPEEIDKTVRRNTDWALENIVRLTPYKNGHASASWVIEYAGYLSYRIRSAIGIGSQYTLHLEYGTGIWGIRRAPIVPKNGKYLVFPILEGNTIVNWVRTTEVNGQMGHFMVQRTLKEALPRLTKGLTNTIRKIWKAKK